MKKNDSEKISRILFCIGILLFISEIWKQLRINCFLKVTSGGYCWWYFPFQLCSTPMYACLLLPFAIRCSGRTGKKSRAAGTFLPDALLTYLVCYGLLAGVFAFFDTSGFSELGDLPLYIHSWAWHILLIAAGLWAGWNSTWFTPDFAGATLLYLAGICIAEVINALAGKLGTINMFYINPRLRMAQAYFSEIAEYAGNGPGIAVYVSSVIVGAAAIYVLLLTLRTVRLIPR